MSNLESTPMSGLAKALARAQADFPSVGKSGTNLFDKYRYAMLEDYVTKVQPILAKHGLSVVTSVLDVQSGEPRTTKGGTVEHVARVRIALRLIHESGEWIEATSWGEGQDRADKAIYKAITGARKYGLAALLGLATTDDPESDETVGRDTGAKAKPVQTTEVKVEEPAKPESLRPDPAPDTRIETGGSLGEAEPTPPSANGQKVVRIRNKDFPVVPCTLCGQPISVAAHILWIEQAIKKLIKRDGKLVSWEYPVHPPGNCK